MNCESRDHEEAARNVAAKVEDGCLVTLSLDLSDPAAVVSVASSCAEAPTNVDRGATIANPTPAAAAIVSSRPSQPGRLVGWLVWGLDRGTPTQLYVCETRIAPLRAPVNSTRCSCERQRVRHLWLVLGDASARCRGHSDLGRACCFGSRVRQAVGRA